MQLTTDLQTQWEEERELVTTKGIAQLKGWIKVGAETYMPKKTFEKYSLDKELTSEEKQKLFNSGDRHPKLYEALKARKKQVHKRPTNGSEKTKQQPEETASRSWTDKEIQDLSPSFIDPRIESLKHLHPHQLNTWQ